MNNLKTKRKMTFLALSLVAFSALADSITTDFIGLSSHQGAAATPLAWEHFKNKISKTGYVVYNPEINLTYEHNGWLLNTTYMKNCLGDDAYLIGAGRQWSITDTFYVALIIGVFDTTKISGSSFTTTTTNQTTHTTTSVTTVSTKKSRSFLPMPLVSITKDFRLTNSLFFSNSLSSNYELTHLSAGLKVRWGK